MRVGFTGTRKGMTDLQKEAVREVLQELFATEVHHGDCVGADADFHLLAKELGLRIVVHPPQSKRFRAFCEGDESKVALPYLLRNCRIVHAVETLIGTPHGFKPLRRSGTWYTIRRADLEGMRTIVVWPDGELSDD